MYLNLKRLAVGLLYKKGGEAGEGLKCLDKQVRLPRASEEALQEATSLQAAAE